MTMVYPTDMGRCALRECRVRSSRMKHGNSKVQPRSLQMSPGAVVRAGSIRLTPWAALWACREIGPAAPSSPVAIGPHAVGWIDSGITEWIDSRPLAGGATKRLVRTDSDVPVSLSTLGRFRRVMIDRRALLLGRQAGAREMNALSNAPARASLTDQQAVETFFVVPDIGITMVYGPAAPAGFEQHRSHLTERGSELYMIGWPDGTTVTREVVPGCNDQAVEAIVDLYRTSATMHRVSTMGSTS